MQHLKRRNVFVGFKFQGSVSETSVWCLGLLWVLQVYRVYVVQSPLRAQVLGFCHRLAYDPASRRRLDLAFNVWFLLRFETGW